MVGVTYESSIKYLKRRIAHRSPGTRCGKRSWVRTSSGTDSAGIGPGAVVLLVFGGSRGAKHLNEAVARLWPALAVEPRLQVVHVAGKLDAATVAESMSDAIADPDNRYRLHEYIERMGDAIAAADVVVARAGATSIAEITAIGRASVLVPYPYATDDHQTLNARAVAAAGGAIVVPDADLETDAFDTALLGLVRDRARRERMAAASAGLGRRDAAERVVAMIRRVAAREDRQGA